MPAKGGRENINAIALIALKGTKNEKILPGEIFIEKNDANTCTFYKRQTWRRSYVVPGMRRGFS